MKKYVIAMVVFLSACGRGNDGVNGSDGVGCTTSGVTVSSVYPYGGVAILCGDSSAVITNGAPGATGPSGATAVTEIIDPCGDAAGIYDEVILRLSSGQLLASVSDNTSGKNTRFSIIPAGSYTTTDGSHCNFTVNSNLSVTW